MKPVIGITGNITSTAGDNGEMFDINYSPRGFTRAIELAGGTPVILPIMDKDNAEDLISICDGILFTGGQDVSPSLYNEEPHMVIGPTSPERDASEVWIFNEAMKQKKPILGVCRGMQLINIVLGGSLYQDLSENPEITIQHQQKTQTIHPTHSITVKEGTCLSKIYQTGDYVNSVHHQVLKDIAPGVNITAWSQDNVVEAIEYMEDGQSIVGLQWHPELNAHLHNPRSLAVFQDLVERAGLAKKQ